MPTNEPRIIFVAPPEIRRMLDELATEDAPAGERPSISATIRTLVRTEFEKRKKKSRKSGSPA